MSLINDALKRARMAQTNPPPPSDAPQFRLIEAGQHTKRSVIMPVASVVALALGLLLAWKVLPRNRLQPVATTPPNAAAKPAPAAAVPTPVPVAQAEPQPQLASESVDVPATPQPVPTGPPPLKLQAILYHPSRPSALISGKTLFVGDKLGEFRVVAISHDTATLVGAGQTNILTLAQ